MNQDFLEIIKKLISEQGKDAFFNSAKCKAFLADYTHGDFKKESRLLLQVIDSGAAKEIDLAENIGICKKQQVLVLREECFLDEEVASDVINILALILRNEPINKNQSISTKNLIQETFKQPEKTTVKTTLSNISLSSSTSSIPDENDFYKDYQSRREYTPYSDMNNNREVESTLGIKIIWIGIICIILIIILASTQQNQTTSVTAPPPRPQVQQVQTQIQFVRGNAVRVRQNARDVNAPHTVLQSFIYTDIFYIGSIDQQGHAILYRDRNYSQLVGRFRTSDLIRQ